MKSLIRLALATGLSAFALASGAMAQSKEPFLVLSFGGPTDDITRDRVAKRFTELTGREVIIRPQAESLVSTLVAQKSNPQYDLVTVGLDSYEFMLKQDVFDKVNFDDIPNSADLYPFAKLTHGMAIGIGGVTLVYNTDKIKQPITSWSDLWRPELKGHVVIPSIPNAYGIDLLVMAAKANGGDEKKIDPGFAKLKELAPSVSAVYESSSHAAQLFQMGGAWIAPWFSGRVPSTQAAGIPVAAADLKEGQVAYLTVVAPLKGKYSKDAALFLNLYISDEAAEGFAKGIGYGPVRKGVKLPDDVAKTVPYGEEQVARLKHLDWGTIVENRVRWGQRFQREIVPLIGQK